MIINKIVHGGPATCVPCDLSFGQYVLDYLRNSDDGVALINGDTGAELTRKQFLHKIVSLASGLKKLGLNKGDVCAICSENREEILVTTIAVICCGAIVTTINAAYTEDELTHVVHISKPNYFFMSSNTIKTNYKYLKKYAFVNKIIQYDDERPIQDGIILYNSLLEKNIDVMGYEPEDMEGVQDVALILYSSGTTGLPKGVMLTHLNFLNLANMHNHAMGDTQIYLTVVPWYHGYGLMGTIKYMMGGRTPVFMLGFQPDKYLGAIQKYKVETLLLVPPILLFLIKSPMVFKYNVTSVKKIVCAAAPLTAETAKLVFARFPNCRGVLQAYGMTETSLSVTMDSEVDFSKNKLGSGGFPLPGVRMKVVDIESRALLGPREKGEICVKCPGLMKGYAGDAAATAAVYDPQGYLKTGDIGYYDEDGYFFISDRLKEIIKYKGYQVAPAEVEGAVLQHAGVAECGVTGVADERVGELVTACVVRKPDHPHLTEKEIVDFVAQKLSPQKQLHGGVVFVSEIPKNPSGKILRRLLRDKLRLMRQSKL